MKRFLSRLLILSLVMSMVPNIILRSEALSQEETTRIMALMKAQGYKLSIRNDKGTWFLNPHVYKEQQKIVYSATSSLSDNRAGMPENNPHDKNRDKNLQWRYLGYSEQGNPIKNGVYIPDVAPVGGDFKTRNWVRSPGAKLSWYKVNSNVAEYMLSGRKGVVSANVVSDTMVNLLGSKASSYIDAKSYAICGALPGIESDGSVTMYHRTPGGSLLYWVFKIPRYKDTLENTIDIKAPEDSKVELGQPYTFDYKVINGISQNKAEIKLTLSGIIKKMNESHRVTINGQTIRNSKDVTLQVDSSGGAVSDYTLTIDSHLIKKGINTIKINASNTYESYLNDNKSGTRSNDATFTLIAYDKSKPYASLKLKPLPSTFKTSSGTKTTMVEMKASVSNTDEKPIRWEFYLDGQLKTTKNGDNSFISTANVSHAVPVSEEKAIRINGKVIAVFKNGQRADATNYCEVTIGSATTKWKPNHEAPPSVDLQLPSFVYVGRDFDFVTIAHDEKDPKSALKYSYDIPYDVGTKKLSIDGGTLSFNQLGEHEIQVNVTDTDGASNFDKDTVFVIPDKPKSVLDIWGKKKVNRRLIISSENSRGTVYSPLDIKQTTFKLTPMAGISQSDLSLVVNNQVHNGLTVVGVKDFKLVSKKKGKIQVELTVTNTHGETSSTVKTIDIGDDLKPIVKVLSPVKVFRSPETKKSVVEVFDVSESKDNDQLKETTFIRVFDTNNDKVFDNELMEYYKDGQWVKTNYPLRDIDNRKVALYNHRIVNDSVLSSSDVVGRYRYEVIVAEDYDERLDTDERVENFIFTSYKNFDTNKVTNTDNVAPVADLNVKDNTREEVHLIVMTDYKGAKFNALTLAVNDLKNKLMINNVILKPHYITNQNKIGTQSTSIKKPYYYRGIKISYEHVETITNNDTHTSVHNKGLQQIDLNIESLFSDTIPSTDQFKYGSTLAYKLKYDHQLSSGMNFSTNISTMKYLFYDVNTPTNNYPYNIEASYLNISNSGGYSRSYLRSLDHSLAERTFKVDYSNWNKWTYGGLRDKHVSGEVHSFDFSDVKALNLPKHANKIILVVSDAKDFRDFTSNNKGAQYPFAGLKAKDLDFITSDKYTVHVMASENILDVKFSKNQHGTTVSTQDTSLRELANITSESSVIKSLDELSYLDFSGEKLDGELNVDGAQVVFTPTETLGDEQDAIGVKIINGITLDNGHVVSDVNITAVTYLSNTQPMPIEGGVVVSQIDEHRLLLETKTFKDDTRLVYQYAPDMQAFKKIKIGDKLSWNTLIKELPLKANQYLAVARIKSDGSVVELSIKHIK